MYEAPFTQTSNQKQLSVGPNEADAKFALLNVLPLCEIPNRMDTY